ncbi:MAG: hypothetical protein KA149_08415 [Chitinophagales bacterium]|nr:hypothetical protein [Chitinophagales bacterium]
MKKNRDEILERYAELICSDSEAARNQLLKLDHKTDAYVLSRIAHTYFLDALFFKNGNMRKRFVTSKLKIAENYIEKAYAINPKCRDLLYTKGMIHNAFHDTWKAIDCYIAIIEQPDKMNLRYNCTGFDIAYNKMVVNDAHFQLYRLFHDLQNYKLSKKFLAHYKKELKKGTDTLYIPLEKFLMS